MSEEEIINQVNILLDFIKKSHIVKNEEYTVELALQGLLDLYTHKKGRVEELKQELLEEKEKNKELKEKMNFMCVNNLNDIYEETLEKTFTKIIKSNMEKGE